MMTDPMGDPSPLETKLFDGVKYQLSNDERNRIENAFVYHSPTSDQPMRYTSIRNEAKNFAYLICKMVPSSRERSLALTKLEEAVMWANAAIARNE